MEHLHSWDGLAVSCIDGMFIKRTLDWISNKTKGIFDFRTEVGASKAILDSEEDRERFFGVVETSLKLHNIKEVWLIDHIDCGAYEGSKKHSSEEEEEKFHVEKLKEAGEIIKAKYPQLSVKKVYVDWKTVNVIE